MRVRRCVEAARVALCAALERCATLRPSTARAARARALVRAGARGCRRAGERQRPQRHLHLWRNRGQYPGAVAFIEAGADGAAARPADRLGDRAPLGAGGWPLRQGGDRGGPGHWRTASSIWLRWTRLSRDGRRDNKRIMLSLMAANNETGVIQPVAEAAEIVHRRRRPAARRCGAGGRADAASTSRRSEADLLDAVGAQARRPAGRRRTDPARTRCISPTRCCAAAGRREAPGPARRTWPRLRAFGSVAG